MPVSGVAVGFGSLNGPVANPPVGIGLDHIIEVEGDNSPREIGPAEMVHRGARRQLLEANDLDVLFRHSAVPANFDGDRGQHLPSRGVRDPQRQAAVGVAVGKIVHPLPLGAGRPNLGRMFRQRVQLQTIGRCWSAAARGISLAKLNFPPRPKSSSGEHLCKGLYCGGRIVVVPHGLTHGEEVRAGVNERFRVRGRYAPNRHAGNFEDRRPPGQDRRIRPVVRGLGGRGIEAPKAT